MPGFQKGPVPNPSFENNDVNHFSQPTEFANDVYVYGKLYADIDASDIFSDGTIEFDGVTVKKNFFVSGLSTFIGPVDMDFLTVFHRLNVGAAGTVFVAISSQRGADDGQVAGRVGIGTTQPDGLFQVGNECFIVKEDPCLVGIANADPSQLLHINSGTNSTVVSSAGTFGVGTDDPGSFGIDNATHGYLRADFDGSVRISRNIYDSANSPGANGFFLQRDEVGIRWVSFEPSFTEGVFVQDEGQYIPITGIAQSFTVFNFKQLNSNGTGVDSLVPIPNPSNPTQIVDIQTKDFWGFTGNDIYRMSNVGIQNNNPTSTLDITGTLHATGDVDFDSKLNVDGDTTLGGTLTVADNSEFNGTVDVDADFAVRDGTTDNFFVDNVTGNTNIVGTLDVGDDAKIAGTTDSTSKDIGALVVEGGVGIEKRLNVGGQTIINSANTSTNKDTGALIVDGGVGIEENINIGGDGVIAGRLDVDSDQDSSSVTTGALVVDGGVGIAKNLNVGSDTKIFGTLELESRIIDFFNNNGVGVCKTDYRLSSFDTSGVGAGVSWRPSGVQTKRTLWVTKNGCDTNSGLLEGDAKFTIGAAAAIAQEGDTIRVRSGTYIEDNPIGLRDDVAINGEDLRLVLLIPKNKNKDFFHVRRGCLIENLSFTGENFDTDDHSNCGAVAFPPTAADVAAGFAFQAVTGFTDLGPADEGVKGRWRSPYVRNCTNFMRKSIGMKINGDHANANRTGENNLGQDLKSMVCDSFTQYNEAGIGVSLSNNAYAQLVSIFTICCDVGIAATSGGQCDLTNSNSSFGNFGLVADGYGDIEFFGTINTGTIAGADSIISVGTTDIALNPRTPFDGQGVYFHLDMNQYADSLSTDLITTPLELVRGFKITNGGNNGDYNAGAPPIVTLSQNPLGPESILPEFSANVSAAGTITSIDVINSGRNFLPNQTLTVNISGGGSAAATVDMDPILFTVSESTLASNNLGISTVTFNEFIPYPIFPNTKVEFVRLSRIITSSHSFEYIGAGTDINKANPFQAGKPVPENEVVAINGGQIPFTSTDQKGNFRIGDGLTIDQTTSTIRGRDFNRAIQAQLTPLILALN